MAQVCTPAPKATLPGTEAACPERWLETESDSWSRTPPHAPGVQLRLRNSQVSALTRGCRAGWGWGCSGEPLHLPAASHTSFLQLGPVDSPICFQQSLKGGVLCKTKDLESTLESGVFKVHPISHWCTSRESKALHSDRWETRLQHRLSKTESLWSFLSPRPIPHLTEACTLQEGRGERRAVGHEAQAQA